MLPRSTNGSLGAALLPDNRVVIAGPKTMLVLLPSGEIDRGFGEGGLATFFMPPGSTSIAITQVSVDSQGRLVVVGHCTFPSTGNESEVSSTEILVERYTADGHLDPSFGGGDGYVITDLGLPPVQTDAHGVFARGATLDEDDRIIISGERGFLIAYYKGEPVGLEESFVARLTPDGEIDRSFARAGVARLPKLFRIDVPVVDRSGGVFVTADGHTQDWVLHLLENGTADPGFDDDGRRQLPYGTYGNPSVDTTGRLLFSGYLSGSRKRGIPDGIMVKRLKLDGSTDRGFGRNGAATLRVARLGSAVLAPEERGGTLVAFSLQRQQPQGRLAAMALVRLRPNGRFDRGFGRGSIVEIPFEGRYAGVHTLDAKGSSALLGGIRCTKDSCVRALARIELGSGRT